MKPRITTLNDTRIKTYFDVNTRLSLMSNQQLIKLLDAGAAGHQGWGISGTIEVNGTKVFYKKVLLTELEKRPENIMSTKNIFDLPLYYQYGVGSAGFGVWRELSAHILTTHWVLTGQCPSFPLMYHWRILPISKPHEGTKDIKGFEEHIKYWNGSERIRNRLEAIEKASDEVVLFLEHFPYTLQPWLEQQLLQSDAAAQQAVHMIEHDILAVTQFMQSHELLHFDAHFGNILTDGKHLYFTDFGLALSSKFALSEAESHFFKTHKKYDKYHTITGLITALFKTLLKIKDPEQYHEILNEYAIKKTDKQTPAWASEIIMRYHSTALVFESFLAQMRNDKAAPYPTCEFEKADKESAD